MFSHSFAVSIRRASSRAMSVAAKRGEQHKGPLIAGAAASLALVSSVYALDHNKTDAESQFLNSTQSAQFQVLAAVEFKQEKQKVELARFLHDLHGLAVEQKRSKLVRESKRRQTQVALSECSQDGQISLKGIDLGNLSPSMAEALIEKIHSGQMLDAESVHALAEASTKVFMKEPSLVDLAGKVDNVTVVGDIHGCLKSLQKVLKLAGDLAEAGQKRAIIINGDYVDRGDNSVEVLLTLLLTKLAHPDKVFLLRGNHECAGVASVYGFLDELKQKYGLQPACQVWDTLTQMFGSLPIAAKTDTACILHGGLPHDQFELSHLAAITPEARSRMTIMVKKASTPEEQLVQRILWSDPSSQNGITRGPRGCGIFFGPDVAQDFLRRHNLKYIVRSHEPVERGVITMPCGDDRYVVTVFSAAAYQGSNLGAIINLDANGNCETREFGRDEGFSFSSMMGSLVQQVGDFMGQESDSKTSDNKVSYEDTLRSFISDNRFRLERYFQTVENKRGLITKAQWVTAMEKELDLQGVAWAELQPSLAPTVGDTDLIDWKEYLLRNTARKFGLRTNDIKTLKEKNDKLLELFEFIDTDSSGEIGPEEFVAGIDYLNQNHLPPEEQIKDVQQLFEALDTDRSGSISMEEFSQLLNHSEAMSNVVGNLDMNEVHILQQNQAILLAAFEFLDTNGNGLIDRTEFLNGVELLNQRLPENARIQDGNKLFSLLDIDGSGEIDVQEFGKMLQLL